MRQNLKFNLYQTEKNANNTLFLKGDSENVVRKSVWHFLQQWGECLDMGANPKWVFPTSIYRQVSTEQW